MDTGSNLIGSEHIIIRRAEYPRTLGAVKEQKNRLVFMEESEFHIHYTAKSVMETQWAFGCKKHEVLQQRTFFLYFFLTLKRDGVL